MHGFSSREPAAGQSFQSFMLGSLAGRVFLLAVDQPTFFKSAPILYPRKLLALVGDEEDGAKPKSRQAALLQTLEDIAVESPWMFGFSDVMYSKTKFSGLEAPYSAIKSSAWYQDLTDLQQAALYTYDLFKATCRQVGHTFLLQDGIKNHQKFYEGRGEPGAEKHCHDFMSALEFLIENEVVRRQVKAPHERFHLMRYWKAEESICESLKSVLTQQEMVLDVDLQDERFARIQSDPKQMAAARSILSKPIVIISGRGGTGKTEVVSAVLSAAEEILSSSNIEDQDITEDGVNSDDSFMSKDQDLVFKASAEAKPSEDKKKEDSMNGPILYCAPTGKAASVIKKRVGSKAFTIHQIISSYKLWKQGEMLNPWKFSPVQIVAVDECSMVSTEVFQWLLKHLIEGARLRKIVLLGDHLQLPSVDPGNFMEDLFTALGPRSMTVTLETNHRSEGNLIFNNATRISRRKMPVFDGSKGFRLIVPDSEKENQLPSEVRRHAAKLPPSTSRHIDLVRSRRGGKDITLEKINLYWSLIKDHRTEYLIEDDEKSQIITFRNAECEALNQFGCFVYNKHLTWETSANSGKQVKQFHVGDKIMCLKNSDVGLIVPEEQEDGPKQETETENVKSVVFTSATDGKFEEDPNIKLKFKTERLMNGNLYKIRAICRADVKSSGNAEDTENGGQGGDPALAASEGVRVNMEYHVLDDLAGDIIRVNLNQLIKKTKISHAWALSIHKFQGSESETIVYGLSGSGWESWQHVYTAVTRGRKSVVIVGSYADLKKAVEKRPIPRQTALGEKVRSLMSEVERIKAARKEEVDQKMTEVKPTQPVTPNKLSVKLSETLTWGHDDDFEDFPFDEIEVGQVGKSPGKRKVPETTVGALGLASPPKIFKANNQHVSAREVKPQQGGSKRLAFDSPATYQRKLSINSPFTYPDRKSKQQALSAEEEPNMNDSFDDFDCSLIEKEAIISSQSVACNSELTQRNLADVFGNEEDDSLGLEDFTDDELAEAVR